MEGKVALPGVTASWGSSREGEGHVFEPWPLLPPLWLHSSQAGWTGGRVGLASVSLPLTPTGRVAQLLPIWGAQDAGWGS